MSDDNTNSKSKPITDDVITGDDMEDDIDESNKPLYWRNPNYNIPDECRFYRLKDE